MTDLIWFKHQNLWLSRDCTAMLICDVIMQNIGPHATMTSIIRGAGGFVNQAEKLFYIAVVTTCFVQDKNIPIKADAPPP